MSVEIKREKENERANNTKNRSILICNLILTLYIEPMRIGAVNEIIMVIYTAAKENRKAD